MGTYTPPQAVALGRNVNEFGRRDPHPDRPRRRDPRASSQKPAVRQITLDQFTRNAVLTSSLTRFATLTEPRWPVGDLLTVTRHERVIDDRGERVVREPPLSLIITSIEPAKLAFISQKTVKSFGATKVTEFALRWMNEHDKRWQEMHPPSDEKEPRPVDVLARWERIWQHRDVFIVRWSPRVPHETRLLPTSVGPWAESPGAGAEIMQPADGSTKLRWGGDDMGEAVDQDYEAAFSSRAATVLEHCREHHETQRKAKRDAYVSPSRRRLLEAGGAR